MAESESPDFTVADKRHSAQADESAEPAGAEPDSTATTAEIETDHAPDAEAGQEDSHAEADSQERFLPDPDMLLSLAAMEMDTRHLARTLIGIFDTHAWRALGLIANPQTGEAQKDLPAAQLAIDCVQFLLGKLESGLNDAERRETQRRLTDLRMNYLAKLREN